jgi:hypothetical protein
VPLGQTSTTILGRLLTIDVILLQKRYSYDFTLYLPHGIWVDYESPYRLKIALTGGKVPILVVSDKNNSVVDQFSPSFMPSETLSSPSQIQNVIKSPATVELGARIPIISDSNRLLTMAGEEDKYESGTITNGYGKAGGVYVSVTKGATADINIDFTISTISEDQFNSWWSSAQTYFDDEQRQKLEENYGAGGFMGGLFTGGFGILFGAGDYNHYKNQSNSHWQTTKENQQGFSKSVYNLRTSQYKVTGTLKATGLSYIPTTVSAYVQTTTITFADGKKLEVIDTSNPLAADPNGDTSRVSSQSTTLHVVPAPSS